MSDVDFRLLTSIAELDAKFTALCALLNEKGLISTAEFNSAVDIVKSQLMKDTFDLLKYNSLIQGIVEHGEILTDADEKYLRDTIPIFNPE